MSDDPMLKEHKATYHGFVRLVTVSTVAVAVVLALMAMFLA